LGNRRGQRIMNTIQVTESEAQDYMFGLGHVGFCLACGERADGCEPDASNYRCEYCGKHEVYGFEELLVMGKVEIFEEDLG